LGKGNPKGFNFIATNAGANKAFISVYTVCLTK
jgi:hypothetical protein